MRKLLYYILFMVAFSSCQNGEKASSITDSKQKAIRIALLPTLDCLPFYYANSTGIFDSLGLNVRLCTYKSAMDADTAFLGTSADVIVSDFPKALLWRIKGDSIGIVATTQLHHYLLTAYAARIRQLSSLKEKIIGITRHSSVDMTADSILYVSGFKSTDLNKPQINNLRLRCLMVDQNQYDGAILPEPYASECEARGARRLIGTEELGLNLSAVITRDSIYRKHKKEITGIMKAWDLAVSDLNAIIMHYDSVRTDTLATPDNIAQAISLMKYFPQQHMIDIPDTLVRYKQFVSHSKPAEQTFTQSYKWLKSRNLIEHEITFKEIVYE